MIRDTIFKGLRLCLACNRCFILTWPKSVFGFFS